MTPVLDPFMTGVRPVIPLEDLATRVHVNKINRLTQSVLSSAGDCLLKAQYTLDRPKWVRRVASSPRAVGTGFHAGLELYYAARRDGLSLPTIDDCTGRAIEIFNTSMTTDLYDNTPIELFLWDDKIPDQATAHKIIGEMIAAYWPNHWPENWDVLAVELNGQVADAYIGVSCKIGADLVLVDPDNWIVGVDFKTGKRRWSEGKENPRKNVQAPFYSRLLRQIYPDHAGYRFAFDVMTYPNTKGECIFERRNSDPRPEHEHAVAEMAKAFVNLYNTVRVEQDRDLPGNPASTLCNPKWCDYWDGCPHGARLDSVADAPTPSVSAIAGEVEAYGTHPLTASPVLSERERALRNSSSADSMFAQVIDANRPDPSRLALVDARGSLTASPAVSNTAGDIPYSGSDCPDQPESGSNTAVEARDSRDSRLALVDARGSLSPSPDEGADWSPDEFKPVWDELKALFDTLDPAARTWRSELVGQAKRRGVSFMAQEAMTERRFHLNRAVIALAIAGEGDDILRELLAHIIGDVALYPGIEPGHALGSLTAVEAERFANHVDAYLTPPPAA